MKRRYRKMPVIVEAEQWWPFQKIIKEVRRRFSQCLDLMPCKYCGFIGPEHGWINTLEGGLKVCPGDYIITGIQGEKYPCKPDIFVRTYESLGDS